MFGDFEFWRHWAAARCAAPMVTSAAQNFALRSVRTHVYTSTIPQPLKHTHLSERQCGVSAARAGAFRRLASRRDSQENVRNPSPKKSEATRKPQNQNSPPHHLAAPFRAPSWEFSPLDQKNHGESIEALRSAHLLQLYEIQAMPGAFQGYLNIRQRMECT